MPQCNQNSNGTHICINKSCCECRFICLLVTDSECRVVRASEVDILVSHALSGDEANFLHYPESLPCTPFYDYYTYIRSEEGACVRPCLFLTSLSSLVQKLCGVPWPPCHPSRLTLVELLPVARRSASVHALYPSKERRGPRVRQAHFLRLPLDLSPPLAPQQTEQYRMMQLECRM